MPEKHLITHCAMTLGYSCIFTRPNAATKFIVGSSLSKCHLLVINEDITTFSWAGREAAGEREAEELKKKQRERERERGRGRDGKIAYLLWYFLCKLSTAFRG